jgi:hypothetical protein
MMEKQFYYEFDENEYYGLVVVTVDDENDLYTKPYRKAAEIYVQTIGGESVDELLEEALPNLRSLEYALGKFIKAPNNEDCTAKDLIKEFEETKNGVLLVDGSLI